MEVRPEKLNEFIGNEEIKQQLRFFLKAFPHKQEVEHILFYGTPGTGKTTLAKIIASELNLPFLTITGNTIKNQRELLLLLWEIEKIQQKTQKTPILFIDEIHAITKAKDLDQTIWLPLLEDFVFYNNLKGKIVVFEEQQYEIISREIQFQPFIIIGATTDIADLHPALRRRFAYQFFMKPYTIEDLAKIIGLHAEKRGIKITDLACIEIAKRSRYTPATAISLLKGCHNRILAEGLPEINGEMVKQQMDMLGIDEEGLKYEDIRVLVALAKFPQGLGKDNLAGTSGINRDVLTEIVEPFLKEKGLMATTSRRIITEKGLAYLLEKGYITLEDLNLELIEKKLGIKIEMEGGEK